MKESESRYCCVKYCENTGENCDLTFFMVPKDPAKAEQWIKALKLKPNLPKRKFICSDHFELKCFPSTLRRTLSTTAVPTLQFKSPKEEGISLGESNESHFVWNSLNCMETETSEDIKPSSEDLCVIANIYVASQNSERNISNDESLDKSMTEQNVSSSTDGSVDRTAIRKAVNDYWKRKCIPTPEEKKAIEKEIDHYLRKRYLNKEKKKAFEEAMKEYEAVRKSKPPHKKRCFHDYQNRSRDSQDMEVSNSSVENQPSGEGNSAARELKVLTCPKQTTTFVSILKQNSINSENITKQLRIKQNLHSTSVCAQAVSNESIETGVKRYLSDHTYHMYDPKTNSAEKQNSYSFSSCVQPSSMKSNHRGIQRHASSDNIPQVYDSETNSVEEQNSYLASPCFQPFSLDSNQMDTDTSSDSIPQVYDTKTNSSEKQNLYSCSIPPSKETGTQRHLTPQASKLVKTGDICINQDKFQKNFSFESDSEYSEFASTIVEKLKQLKNPDSRAKAVNKIHRILLEAKSDENNVGN